MVKIILCLLMLPVIGCQHIKPEPSPSENLREVQDSHISIEEEETVVQPALGLFLSLNEVLDSRCPQDVQCITAGEARATFVITNQKTSSIKKEFILCLGCPEIPDSAGIKLGDQEYGIKLNDIKPYPYSDSPETNKDKTAEITLYEAE